MTQTTVMHTDLDRLAERVEKAAALVQQLRTDRENLERERDELANRVGELENKLQGQDPGALLAETKSLKGDLDGLRKEQREWQSERRDAAIRIEGLVKKLERLDS